MPDRAVPKAHPQAKPRYPSRLRNEVHTSEIEHGITDQDLIQVPDSQVVIPETQLETQHADSLRPNSRGEPPLSPKSQKVLTLHLSKPQVEARSLSKTPIVLLSRPAMNSEPDFAFAARKFPSKNASKGETLSRQAPYAPVVSNVTSGDDVINCPKNAGCVTPETREPQRQPLVDLDRAMETPDTLRAASHSNSMDRQVDNPQPFDLTVIGDHVSTPSHADILATSMTRNPREQLNHSMADPVPRSLHLTGPNDKPTGKLRKSRRSKREKHDNKENRKQEGAGIEVSTPPQGQSTFLSLPEDIVNTIEPGDGTRNDTGAPRKPQQQLHVTEEVCSEPREQAFQSISGDPQQGNSRQLPAPHGAHTNFRNFETTQGPNCNHDASGHQQYNESETVPQQYRPVGEADGSAFNMREPSNQSGVQDAFHTMPQNDSYRITKKRKHIRTDEDAPTPTQISRVLSDVSPKNLSLIGFFAQIVQTNEHEVRGNTDAFVTSKAALEKVIETKSEIIAVLGAGNKKLQEDLASMRRKFKDMQEGCGGAQSGYQDLKQHAETYRKNCDEALQSTVAECNNYKAELAEDFTVTLDAVNRNRLRMKAVLDDCFMRLTVVESTNAALTTKLAEQAGLYQEEKQRRQDLEQKTLSTLQTMMGNTEARLESFFEELNSVRQSGNDAASGAIRHGDLEKILKPIKSLLEAPLPTVKHISKAENMIRYIGEHIDMKFAEVVGPIQGLDFSRTELRHFVEQQLHSLRDDIIKSNEAADRHREAQQENEKLLQKLEDQREKARELDEKIIRHQEAETQFESRRLLMEQELKDSQQICRMLLSELIILRDELKESTARLRRQGDELESAKEEVKKQSSLLLEARDMQRHRTTKDSEKAIQDKIQLATVRDQLHAAEQKALLLEAELRALEEEHHVVAQRETYSTVEMIDVSDQLDHAMCSLQLKQKELTTLSQDNDKLKRTADSDEKKLTKSQEQLVQKQSTIDQLRKELDAETQKNDERSASLRELQDEVKLLKRQRSEAEAAAQKASSQERKLNEDYLDMQNDRDSLKSQLADVRGECDAKDVEIQGLQETQLEELEKIRETHKRQLEEALNRMRQAEKMKVSLQAANKRLEDEQKGQIEAHKKLVEEKFVMAVENRVQECIAQHSSDASGQGRANYPSAQIDVSIGEAESSGPSKHDNALAKKRVVRDNTSTLKQSIYTDFVPDTQEPDLISGTRSDSKHPTYTDFVPETQDLDPFHELDGMKAKPRNLLGSQCSDSSLSDPPSDMERDTIDMSEPMIKDAKQLHRAGRLWLHNDKPEGQHHTADATHANTDTRIERSQLSSTESHKRSSGEIGGLHRSVPAPSSNASHCSEPSSYDPSSQGQGSTGDSQEGKRRTKCHSANTGNSSKLSSETNVNDSQTHEDGGSSKRKTIAGQGRARPTKRARTGRPQPTRSAADLLNHTRKSASSSSRRSKGVSQAEMIGRFDYELQSDDRNGQR